MEKLVLAEIPYSKVNIEMFMVDFSDVDIALECDGDRKIVRVVRI